MPLQIKRGTNDQRLTYTPAEGELVFVTDYVAEDVDPLWIGNAAGTLGGVSVSSAGGGGITELVSDTTPQLGGALDLNGFEINGIGDVDITGTIASTGAITSPSFVGDLKGSVFLDDSSTNAPLVDGISGDMYPTALRSISNKISVYGESDSAIVSVNVHGVDERGGVKFIRESDSDLSGTLTLPYGQLYFGRDDSNGAVDTAIIIGRGDGLYFGTDTGGDFTTADKYVVVKAGNVGIKNTFPAVELDVAGDANITGSLTAGAMLLSGSIIDTSDSSPITVTPGVTFSSDVTIQNDLVVSNTITVDTLEVTNFVTQGAGTPELSSDTAILLTAGTRVEVTQSPFKMASYTTAERDALSSQNGDMIYNTTTNKFQGYANSAWVDLH